MSRLLQVFLTDFLSITFKSSGHFLQVMEESPHFQEMPITSLFEEPQLLNDTLVDLNEEKEWYFGIALKGILILGLVIAMTLIFKLYQFFKSLSSSTQACQLSTSSSIRRKNSILIHLIFFLIGIIVSLSGLLWLMASDSSIRCSSNFTTGSLFSNETKSGSKGTLFYSEMKSPSQLPAPLFPKMIHIPLYNVFSPSESTMENLNQWQILNPEYYIRVYDEEDMRFFVTQYFPEFLDIYESLETSEDRINVWKYMVLYQFGGVYIDPDIICIKPLRLWNELFTQVKNESSLPEVFVGVDSVTHVEIISRSNTNTRQDIQLVIWALAAVSHHLLFLKVLTQIQKELFEASQTPDSKKPIRGRDAAISERTGAKLFTKVVEDWVSDQGLFLQDIITGNPVVDGVGFLEQGAFGTLLSDTRFDNINAHRVHVLHP